MVQHWQIVDWACRRINCFKRPSTAWMIWNVPMRSGPGDVPLGLFLEDLEVGVSTSFHIHGGTPKFRWFISYIMEYSIIKPIYKWMMTGGTPSWRNGHLRQLQAASSWWSRINAGKERISSGGLFLGVFRDFSTRQKTPKTLEKSIAQRYPNSWGKLFGTFPF